MRFTHKYGLVSFVSLESELNGCISVRLKQQYGDKIFSTVFRNVYKSSIEWYDNICVKQPIKTERVCYLLCCKYECFITRITYSRHTCRPQQAVFPEATGNGTRISGTFACFSMRCGRAQGTNKVNIDSNCAGKHIPMHTENEGGCWAPGTNPQK